MTSSASDLTPARVTMYGAEWCSDCRRSKALLDRLEVEYDYVDLELVIDGADRAKAISGRTQIPVVVFPDGTHFTEPTDAELAAKLDEAVAA
ncbi:glutaredoxin family protein [Agromyces subbeticus]|uniref:glutaredoxin family protein n=1 Tax=Agromyces subbeticus TaxID=293890 RepID=UPI0003B36C32|nr:glutaredoxin domain-containing protein [Agromyces subbeticus]